LDWCVVVVPPQYIIHKSGEVNAGAGFFATADLPFAGLGATVGPRTAEKIKMMPIHLTPHLPKAGLVLALAAAKLAVVAVVVVCRHRSAAS
jgi:hypothetical protein